MGLFKDKEEALRMADHLIAATRAADAQIIEQARQRNESTPTTVRDEATNSTTVIHGDHHGVAGGVHHGSTHYRFDR